MVDPPTWSCKGAARQVFGFLQQLLHLDLLAGREALRLLPLVELPVQA